MINKDYISEKDKYNLLEDVSLKELKVRYQKVIDEEINLEFKELLIWEKDILEIRDNALYINFGYKSRFSGVKWEEMRGKIERLAFYEENFKNSTNKYLRLRYLDYFIEIKAKVKYIYAKTFCNEGLVILQEDMKNDRFFIATLSRVINIATKFNLTDNIEEIKEVILSYLQNLKETSKYEWVTYISVLSRVIIDKWKDNFTKEWKEEVEASLKESLAHFGQKEFKMYESISFELVEWLKLSQNKKEEIDDILKGIGNMFEIQADYQCDTNEKSSLIEADFLEKAINIYKTYGFKADIDRVKSKIKIAYIRAEELKEWKKITSSMQISNEQIDEYIKIFERDDIEEAFMLLSIAPDFIPKLDEIEKQVSQNEKQSLTRLFGQKIIGNGKKINEISTDEQWLENEKNKSYFMYLEITYEVFFTIILEKLNKKGLNYDFLASKINNWEYISENNKVMVNLGLRHFFNKDYISAMHILIPRFESCFREFFEYVNYPTTALKKDEIQTEQSLSEFVRNDFVKKNIDKDFLFYIKFIMIEPLGYNFRNDLAHGLIEVENLNYKNSCMVLYLYIKMLSYKWTL